MGSQDRRLWKDGNRWISILAVGGEKRNRGVSSDGEGVFPSERLFRDALSGENCQQIGGAGVCWEGRTGADADHAVIGYCEMFNRQALPDDEAVFRKPVPFQLRANFALGGAIVIEMETFICS